MSSLNKEDGNVTEPKEIVAVNNSEENLNSEMKYATEDAQKENLSENTVNDDPTLIEGDPSKVMDVSDEQQNHAESPKTDQGDKTEHIVTSVTANSVGKLVVEENILPCSEQEVIEEHDKDSVAPQTISNLDGISEKNQQPTLTISEPEVENTEANVEANCSKMETCEETDNIEKQLDYQPKTSVSNVDGEKQERDPTASNQTSEPQIMEQSIVEIKDGPSIPPSEEKMTYRKFTSPYDSESSVSSDESSIHLSSDSEDNADKKVVKKSGGTGPNPEANKGTKKSKGQRNKELFEVDMRTKGELTLDDLPTLDELKIDVDPKVVLMEVGAVQSVIGPIVVVQANKLVPALDQDTILFREDRTPVGQVFETFGPVQAPLYVVRFNNPEEIGKHNLSIGSKLFYAPEMKEYTRFVFVEQLKQIRGSDASWEHNNEPPEKYLDFSDDEEERRARQRARGHDVDEGEEDTEKKRRKRKPHSQNKTSDGSHKESRSHQSRLTQWPPKDTGHGWRGSGDLGPRPQWPPAPPPGGVGYRQGPGPSPSSGPWGMRPHHPGRTHTPPGPPPRTSLSPAPPAWGGMPGPVGPAPPAWGGQPGLGGPPMQAWHHQNTSGFNDGRPRRPPQAPQQPTWGAPDGNPAHGAPMDTRYVQNMHGPGDCGPEMMGPSRQGPQPPQSAPYPSWHAPRPPSFEGPPAFPQGQHFRPEFRGPSNFSQGQSPRPEFGGAPNFYQGPNARPPFGGGAGFAHGPPRRPSPFQFEGTANFTQGPPGWNS